MPLHGRAVQSPAFSADGSTFLYHAAAPDGFGSLDLWAVDLDLFLELAAHLVEVVDDAEGPLVELNLLRGSVGRNSGASRGGRVGPR